MFFYSSSYQRMILEDEISLAPSLTTIYATAYSSMPTNTSDIIERMHNLLNLGKDRLPPSTSKTENLPCHEDNSEHDSSQKMDSQTTSSSHGNHFSSQTIPQGHNYSGMEALLAPSHHKPTIIGTNESIPTPSDSSNLLSSNDGHTNSTMLNSPNNGYNTLDAPGSRQCHDLISSSAAEYQPAHFTIMPHLTPSLSELCFSVELAEEQEPIEQRTTLDAFHGDPGCSPVLMPASEVDSGYKQVDFFLSSEVPAGQSFLTMNVLRKAVPLDEAEAHYWEESLEETTPNHSSTSTKKRNIPLTSREQLLHSHVSLHSNRYLNDNLCIPHSCKDDHDKSCSFVVDQQSRYQKVSLDSTKFSNSNLPSSPSRAPQRDKENVDVIYLPVAVLHDMGPDGNLQASEDVAMECDCKSVFLPDLANSRQDDKGHYIHAVVQSGQDGIGYNDCGLKPFPSVAKDTEDLIPCCDGGHVSKEYPLLKEENFNCNVAECLTMPHSKGDVEINFTFSDNDESLTSLGALDVHPVQTSALHPTVCSSLPELNDSSKHAKSVGPSSSTRNGMPRTLHLTTDDYIYT